MQTKVSHDKFFGAATPFLDPKDIEDRKLSVVVDLARNLAEVHGPDSEEIADTLPFIALRPSMDHGNVMTTGAMALCTETAAVLPAGLTLATTGQLPYTLEVSGRGSSGMLEQRQDEAS